LSNFDTDTVVIGSGSGGLTAGLALANAGNRVMVLEQHYVPGGWCHNFTKEGFSFCPGVHYIGRLGKDGETRLLYEGLGVGRDLVFFEQNPDGYEHCNIEGVKFDYPNNLQKMTERLKTQFPNDRVGIDKYMWLLQQLVDELPRIFEVNTFMDFMLVPYRTRHIGRYGLFSLKRTLEDRISNPIVRSILSVQCGDQGLPPGKTMMMLHAGLARHYDQGGYYPKGGGGAIARAMVNAIKKTGSKVKIGTHVDKILIEKQGSKQRAIGVRLRDGRDIRCRQVISNADPRKTFSGMVGEEYLSRSLRRRLSRVRYSLSSLSLFLGIDISPRSLGLDSGNIWFAKDGNFDRVFERVMSPLLYEDDEFGAIFISAPTLKDPTAYNGKGHTLEVVTFVGYEAFRIYENSVTEQRPEAYSKLKAKVTAMFMKSLEKVIPNLSKHIIFSDVGTPLTNSYYIESTEGSVYGVEKNYRQIGPLAFKSRTEINGLYMAGASTMSHGVSGAAMSGLHAAAAILDTKWDKLLKPDKGSLKVYSAEDSSEWPEAIKAKIRAPRESQNRREHTADA
jgi:all-trans-retinol 13,14-reductase